MNKNIIFKGIVSLLLFLLAACAPTVEGVKGVISGNVKAQYMGSAAEIIAAIDEIAISVQTTSSHTPYFVQSKSVNTIILLAKPLAGSALSASMDARAASELKITITLENRGDYVHLLFSPSPSSDEARASQNKFIEELDKRFVRYQKGVSLNTITKQI